MCRRGINFCNHFAGWLCPTTTRWPTETVDWWQVSTPYAQSTSRSCAWRVVGIANESSSPTRLVMEKNMTHTHARTHARTHSRITPYHARTHACTRAAPTRAFLAFNAGAQDDVEHRAQSWQPHGPHLLVRACMQLAREVLILADLNLGQRPTVCFRLRSCFHISDVNHPSSPRSLSHCLDIGRCCSRCLSSCIRC